MLWNRKNKYLEKPYDKEAELEDAVNEVKGALFGSTRIYLDDKRKIGKKGGTNNLPDGYLIDLTNSQEPKIFVVENDPHRINTSSILQCRYLSSPCLLKPVKSR